MESRHSIDPVEEASWESFPASDSPAWAMDTELEEAGEPVENSPVENRFEVTVDGETAYLKYDRTSHEITLHQINVPGALEGRGIASALAHAGLEFARRERLAVIPVGSFVRGYIRRHQHYLDLVRPDYQASVR